MSLLPGKQMLIHLPIQSKKYRKNGVFNLYVHNEVQEINGDVFCLSSKNKICL